MPLDEALAKKIDEYARADLPGDLAWHIDQFKFLADDQDLQNRVGEEFFSARYMYKLFEGIRLADKWAQDAQVRLQILQYSSIYEACLHHVLFVLLGDRSEVQNLGRYKTLKKYSVPAAKLELIQHDNRLIVAAFEAEDRVPASKVRFEDKAEAAVALRIIQPMLAEELKSLYEARNSIHLHAELKKGLEWEVEVSRLAYRRILPFCEQVTAFVSSMPSSKER